MPFKMVDMARTPEEVKEQAKEMAAPCSLSIDNMPKYPWGLCIRLGTEEMEKLGLTADCKVGETIHVMALAKVTSVSSSETEGGQNNNVELQITHLGLEDESSEEQESPKRFGPKSLYKR